MDFSEQLIKKQKACMWNHENEDNPMTWEWDASVGLMSFFSFSSVHGTYPSRIFLGHFFQQNSEYISGFMGLKTVYDTLVRKSSENGRSTCVH